FERSTESVTVVPVGAILVASICLTFLDEPLTLRYRGPEHIACQAAFSKGDEMGYFRHGSTIVVVGSSGLTPAPNVREGQTIRMGTPLLLMPRDARTRAPDSFERARGWSPSCREAP